MQERLAIPMKAGKLGWFNRKACVRYFSEAASGVAPDMASSATGARPPADMAAVLSIVCKSRAGHLPFPHPMPGVAGFAFFEAYGF
jgi:hypothetical protein